MQKKIDLVVLGDFVANKFFKEYVSKGTLKREFEANKKYFLGLAKKYKTTIVAPVIEWDEGKVYKSILVASGANSASCGDFSHLRKARFLDEPSVLSSSLASHKCENSSTILEFASCVESAESNEKNAESNADSANKKKSSLRADSQNLRGKPPYEKSQNPQSGLPRSHSLARNDEILDSSLRKCSAQNDKNSVRVAESSKTTQKDDEFTLDSAESQNLCIYRATRLMNFPHWNERAFFDNAQKAQEPLIFSVGDFKVSAIFGWEAHFDEIMTKLRKKGVDILCVPCANTFGSNARWQRLMQTRAFLNSCFIVRVNRTGEFVEDGNIWEFYGESFIALPDGSLGDMMGGKEGILISEIEKENLEEIKNLWQFR